MAEDVAELETRPAEPKRNEKPAPAPPRRNDDRSQQKDGTSKDREVREVDKFPAPLPRWPFVLVALVAAIFATVVL
jgi:membrane fusion protein (multidrug efflux system)